jgi:hypothetical protein
MLIAKQMYDAVHDLKVTCGDLNVPKFKLIFKLEGARFDQFWSALDQLEDTAEALDAYLEASEEASLGQKYLHLFGALQCLSMQQDAIRTAYQCLGCSSNLQDQQTLVQVRDIRNRVCHASDFGHERNGSIQVLRLGLSSKHVGIVCWSSRKSETMHFDPTELIVAQNGIVLELVIRAGMLARDRFTSQVDPTLFSG